MKLMRTNTKQCVISLHILVVFVVLSSVQGVCLAQATKIAPEEDLLRDCLQIA